ncbi:hypothetical protein Nepgr_024512 [Nepenthes gracilis]|uniref:Uncharacterized protein n=1 Tax=Nepenthes gracilis TaxID=150966 RepID=A0AAD3T5C2_NEPGR|nr:hypothetical protein Nepgr_024512 [Nepenthes gracilis]
MSKPCALIEDPGFLLLDEGDPKHTSVSLVVDLEENELFSRFVNEKICRSFGYCCTLRLNLLSAARCKFT